MGYTLASAGRWQFNFFITRKCEIRIIPVEQSTVLPQFLRDFLWLLTKPDSPRESEDTNFGQVVKRSQLNQFYSWHFRSLLPPITRPYAPGAIEPATPHSTLAPSLPRLSPLELRDVLWAVVGSGNAKN